MNKEEHELHSIISQFRPRVEKENLLVRKLLRVKARYEKDKKLSQKAISTAQQRQKFNRLKSLIDDAALTYEAVYPDLWKSSKPLKLERLTVEESTIYQFSANEPELSDNFRFDQYSALLFADMLVTIQTMLDDVSNLEHIQPNYSYIQHDAVTFAANECFPFGVKISASENSQFFKIVQWLLGTSDPSYAIKKAKPFIG